MSKKQSSKPEIVKRFSKFCWWIIIYLMGDDDGYTVESTKSYFSQAFNSLGAKKIDENFPKAINFLKKHKLVEVFTDKNGVECIRMIVTREGKRTRR